MSGITFREENTSGQFAQRWRERDLSYKSCNNRWGRAVLGTTRQNHIPPAGKPPLRIRHARLRFRKKRISE